MSINELLSSHTHRQLQTWLEWIKINLNHPGKVENYLMSVAAEVRRSGKKNPALIKVSDLKLKWDFPDDSSSQEASPERIAASKSYWARLKANPKKFVKPPAKKTGPPKAQPKRQHLPRR